MIFSHNPFSPLPSSGNYFSGRDPKNQFPPDLSIRCVNTPPNAHRKPEEESSSVAGEKKKCRRSAFFR